MQRNPDWLDKLHAIVESRRNVPHEFGRNDCCLFVADAVQAMTGTDPAAEYRGYATEEQARAILKKAGGMRALLTGVFGEPRSLLTARRGDIVLAIADDGTPTVGICLGSVVAYVAAQGLQLHPLACGQCAWGVG